MKTMQIAALALAFGVAVVPAARAATGAQCVLRMAKAETEARVSFETGLVKLVEGVAPDAAETAAKSRDVQVLLAKDRLDRVAYLAEARPSAFDAETGAVKWTEADETGYMADQSHAERMARVRDLGRSLEGSEDLAALQEVFRKTVVQLAEFQTLMATHNAARRDAADAFTECRKD